MKKILFFTLLLVSFGGLFFSSCQKTKIKGKLFIIGGGEISSAVIDKMITESGIKSGGYGIILPMSGQEPDSSIYYAKADFVGRGSSNIYGLNFTKGEVSSPAKIDSIRNARLIFISGGDQSRFMDIISGTQVKQAIHDAFRNGSLVCGTSAGAALMSKKMITGNELKYPENEGSFKTIEEKNIETIEGLGLLEKTIIDQHFIKRKRLNRLISVSLENPEYTCVGIDESTAILVDGNAATVYGDNQVISLQNTGSEKKVVNSLLGGKDLWLNVFLPGESFKIKK